MRMHLKYYQEWLLLWLVYEIVSLLILIVIVVVKCRLIGKIRSFEVIENIVLNIQGRRLVRQIWRHSVCIYIIFELVG